jgi:hypothetical protein
MEKTFCYTQKCIVEIVGIIRYRSNQPRVLKGGYDCATTVWRRWCGCRHHCHWSKRMTKPKCPNSFFHQFFGTDWDSLVRLLTHYGALYPIMYHCLRSYYQHGIQQLTRLETKWNQSI